DGMRDILRRYQPSRLEDLTALNALYRPGPIQGGMVDDFIERKWGRRAVAYDLPELKELLEETYGVIVYQEQVMQISNRVAGYSLGDADLLRRAMGKKKVEEMAKQRERFIKGALERGFNQKKVEKIFDLMEQFAGYGFNKSHSAAYAFLAYVTAYLKAHYPVDFLAALLTSETGNTAKVVKYINECRDMGIHILPPDVNHSEWSFTPDGEAIRFGLGAVKNLGQSAVEAIGKARDEGGKFTSLYEFCERVDLGAVNRRMIESLIKAGAMDSLEGTRSQKFAATEGAMEAGQRAWRDRESGQEGLFGEVVAEGGHQYAPLPRVPDWTDKEKLAYEKELLGFWVTGHPLDNYADKVAELATHDSASLEGLEKNTEVKLCGVLTGVTRKRNKEGKPWAAMTIEDRAGSIDGMCFTTNYERLASQIVEDQVVLIRGLVLPEENAAPKISVQDIVALDNARVDLPGLISIRIWIGRNGGADRAAALGELFKRKPGDTSVRLRLEAPRDFSVVLDVPAKVRPDREFRKALEQICGPECMERAG
ncbi:MAG: DNA polymerase III subunit alpha, partial [Acidobacteria bacterium]|nr:DNA polymerase III subunit alpha [Acidobacteriota bacterium]